MDLKPLRAWRFASADPYGMTMWFDPSIEQPQLTYLNDAEKEILRKERESISVSAYDPTDQGELPW